MTFIALPSTIREDERLSRLSDRACLFFVMLIAQVDAHGRIGASPKLLNATVWPLRERTAAETAKCLEECRAAGVLEVLTAGSLTWLQVEGWDDAYQMVGANRQKRPKSSYPDRDSISMPSRSTPIPDTPDRDAIAQVGRLGVGAGEVVVSSKDGEPERKGQRGTELTRFWSSEWERTRLGQAFDWSQKADAIALVNLAKTHEDSEIKFRITRLLESTDRWKAENATPRILLSQWNSLAVEIVPQAPQSKGQQMANVAIQNALKFAAEAKVNGVPHVQ